MRGTNRMHVTGEMQVDILHRHHLRKTATGGAALQAETGSQTGFAQTDRGVRAKPVHGIGKPDGHGGLALARRRGTHGGDQHQLAVGALAQGVNVLQGKLGLAVTVGNQLLCRYAQPLADPSDRKHLCLPGRFLYPTS